MKKKSLNIIYFFITVCLFCFITDVNASVYQCEYKFGDTDALNHTIEYDTDKGTYKPINERSNTVSGFNTYSYTYSYDFVKEEIMALSDNECPILHLVDESDIDPTATNTPGIVYYTFSYNYSFFSDSNRMLEKFGTDVDYLTGVNVNDGSISISICPSLNVLTAEIERLYAEYDACSGAKCSHQYGKAKEAVEKLRIACKDILSNRDVVIGNVDEDKAPTKDECINKCLNIEKEIEEIKDNLGIEELERGSCGFSTRLASWGLNIMKWVKYIVPVFVIIFGIFDFIKAIGADKEDEMKKSQKKFITRLIAAALIFIIPFILEFVLDKFGFTEYIDGCGVIEEIG